MIANTRQNGPRYRQCCMIERGAYNYRWPFNEFCLHIDNPPLPLCAQGEVESPWTSCACPVGHHDVDPCGGKVSVPVGTLARVSFMREGVLYQLLRLDARHKEASDDRTEKAELILTIEGPMRLQSFRRLNGGQSKEWEIALSPCPQHPDTCLIGMLDGSAIHWQPELFHFDLKNGGPAYRVPLKRLKDDKEKQHHCFKTDDDLEPLPRFQAELEEIDTNSCHVFVAAFRLVDEASVAYSNPINIPPHEVIAEFLRCGSPRAPGTASMWRSVFSWREDSLDYIPELREEHIVGRCLEKILSVDVVPARVLVDRKGLEPRHHLAIVSNMFHRANVDLEAFL